MDLYDKFKIIEAYFAKLDEEKRKESIKLHFDTQYGIWGPSSMLDVFELFGKMKLDEKKHFLDLGSGDGRIVLIAALFTDAAGIEGDDKLDAMAKDIKNILIGKIPELARASFMCADYTQANLAKYDVLFTFCDHAWDPDFERKLQRECTGVLLSYNRIFLPEILKKGKTYWMQQLPIVTYWLNRDEHDLLARKEGIKED
jgi:hypothetical protein